MIGLEANFKEDFDLLDELIKERKLPKEDKK